MTISGELGNVCAALSSFQQKPDKTNTFFFLTNDSTSVIPPCPCLLHHRHVCYPIISELNVFGPALSNFEHQIFHLALFPSAWSSLCHL